MKWLECPACKATLSTWRVRSEFACPSCNAALTMSYWPALVAVIVLWTALEAVLTYLLNSHLLGSVLSAVVALALWGPILSLARIGRAEASN